MAGKFESKPLYKKRIITYDDYPPDKEMLLAACRKVLGGIKSKRIKPIIHHKARIPSNSLVIHEYDIHRCCHEYHIAFYLDGTEIHRENFGSSWSVDDLLTKATHSP
jgi:hypothetical protein